MSGLSELNLVRKPFVCMGKGNFPGAQKSGLGLFSLNQDCVLNDMTWRQGVGKGQRGSASLSLPPGVGQIQPDSEQKSISSFQGSNPGFSGGKHIVNHIFYAVTDPGNFP